MAKFVFGKGGVVVNVVNAPTAAAADFDGVWSVPDATIVNVGDAFDPKDPQIDAVDAAVFQVLVRHENLIRQLIRTIRTNSALNTQATAAGLPTTANASDLTQAQARAAFKGLIP
jgi:transcriptional regulator of nitric oxide reductase